MQYLYKLKKSDYLQGAKKVWENSNQHYLAAQQLASGKFFSFAISHIILSGEELIKATILKIKSTDNSLKIHNLDNYFRSHQLKQNKLLEIISSFRNHTRMENNETLESKLLKLILAAIIIFGLYFKSQENLLKSAEEIDREEKDLINSIEKLRLSSTYVELLNSKIWRSPHDSFDEGYYKFIKNQYESIWSTLSDFILYNNLSQEQLDLLYESLLKEDNNNK